MHIKQRGEVGIDMKREYRPEWSVSRRDMASAMSTSNAIFSAERNDFALRFGFLGFWFTKIPVRES